MSFWRMAILILVALSTIPPAWGRQSGVLVGFLAEPGGTVSAQSFDDVKEPKYQTVWIAPDATGKLAVLATMPDLIVPRKDGFWHVGLKQVCEFTHNVSDVDGGSESILQALWRAPIAKPGIVSVRRPCAAHEPGDYAPPYPRSEQDKNKISQCGLGLMDIEYVSPVVLSIRKDSGQSGECEERGGRFTATLSVIGYDSDEKLTVSHLLGPEAQQAYVKALPKHAQNDEGRDCGDPTTADDEWRIGRNAGRWSAFAHQDLGFFNCSVDALMRFRLPSSVTGDNSPQADWKVLQAKVKDLQDTYVSPAKDLLIVMTGTELRFHEYAEGEPGKLLLTLPAQPIVMVQWSTGTHVQGWTNQLQEISKHPLPEPEVRVVPAANQRIQN